MSNHPDQSNAQAPGRKRRTTSGGSRMADVARLAGVSMITVSRVLNLPDKVASKTRDVVLAAIRKSGYVPNLTAGSLASNKSRIIGAIVPTIDNSIFAETVRGLSEALAKSGFQLLLGQSNYDETAEGSLVEAFLGRRVDGLVLTGGSHSKAMRQRLQQSGVPVVETWDLPRKPIDMVAGFSNVEAGRAVAAYLLAKGHLKLGFVGGPDDRSDARLAGMRAALKGRRGVSLQVVRPQTGASFQGGRGVIAQFAIAGTMPQAIFFGNDALAAGALLECQSRAIEVPTQLAVVGFADLAIASAMEPALTTVRVPTARMGQSAAHMLLARLAGQTLEEPVRDLGFELVTRASA
jgi:LacI family transcriptional regulator, gluconate utilization system Gnt-I transcriptional repressor